MSLESDTKHLLAIAFADSDHDAETTVELVKRVLSYPGGSLVISGLMVTRDEVELRRVVSFALREAPLEATWPAWTILLLAPYDDDSSVLLNTLGGLHDVGKSSAAAASIPQALVGGFLAHSLSRSPLVAERAVSAALAYPHAAWSLTPTEFRRNTRALLTTTVDAVDDPALQSHWRAGLERLDMMDATEGEPMPASDARLAVSTIYETIKGRSARELAGAADSLLDSYFASGARGIVRPVQRLELRARRPLNATIWEIVGAWSDFFQQVAEEFFDTEQIELLLSNATTGSLRIEQVIDLDKPGDDVEGLTGRLSDALSTKVRDSDVESLLRFLESIAGEGVTLTARHYWGRRASTQIDLTQSQIRDLRRAASNRRVLRVPSADVPQADRLEKIMRLIELTNEGSEVTRESIDLVPRQIHYYQRAAKILLLLDEDGLVAPAGLQLLRLDEESRWKLLVVLFEMSRCASAWIEWSNAKTILDVDPESAATFIHERVDGLTGETVGRRVQCLQTWVTDLKPYHYVTSS
jgi:hypothetical protein